MGILDIGCLMVFEFDVLLVDWFDVNVMLFDMCVVLKVEVVLCFVVVGLFWIGVLVGFGGVGGIIVDVIVGIVVVVEYLLIVVFVLWGQCSFIEYLL